MLGDVKLVPGDLDNDGDIDLDDFAILEATFRLSQGDTNYNEDADLIGNDNHVNIHDMVLIGANFGKTTSNQ